jgi:FkbM family methyltransferase
MVLTKEESALRRIAWRLIAPAIGSRLGGWLSEQVVKIGMRGMGVNVGYRLEESGESWLIPRLLAACPMAICADVGANVGEYSALLLRHGARRVYAFEPVPSTYSKLSSRLAKSDRAICVQRAVGEHAGMIDIHLPGRDDLSTLASRDQHVAAFDTDNIVVHSAQMITLDAYAGENNVFFDFIKIDVEGFELEVLMGARRLISDQHLAVLQIEFNRHHMMRRQYIDDFASALPGYLLFRLTPRSLFPVRLGHYLSNIYTFQNLVAIREDRHDVLRGLGR